MSQIIPSTNKYLSHLKLVEYLLGFDIKPTGKMLLESGNPAPRLTNPLKAYIEKVNRFLFSGGITVDIKDASQDDPRQFWLEQQAKQMNLDQLANLAWERGSVTGEIAIVFTQATKPDGSASMYFNVDLFDYPEFTPKRDENGTLTEINVLAHRDVDGEDYIFKAKYTAESYTVWPLILADKASSADWQNSGVVTPHPYRVLPGVVIRNKLSDLRSRGLSDFDKAAVEMATELVLQEIFSAENHWFFAHPFISSDDPESVLEAIRSRSQVLQAGSVEDAGHPVILQPTAMPESHDRLLERVQRNLWEHLGISTQTDQAPPDTSSLTLRMLNAATISTAEKRWSSYVTHGLRPLLENMLLAAAANGVLAGVWPSNPETYELTISRAAPYFSVAPIEKQSQLAVAETLVSLGVKREVALAREYFTELTIEQVAEMIDENYLA